MIGTVAPRLVRLLLTALLGTVLALTSGCTATAAPAAGQHPAATATATATRTVALSSLPRQATDTYRLIRAGGPYPEKQDGTVFSNREGVLPTQRSGYYHEYTVETPGSDDRGARRIVAGSGGEYYYTGDHYATFVAVDVTR